MMGTQLHLCMFVFNDTKLQIFIKCSFRRELMDDMIIVGLTGMPSAGKGTALDIATKAAQSIGDVFFTSRSTGDLIRLAERGEFGEKLQRKISDFYEEHTRAANIDTEIFQEILTTAQDSAREANFALFIWDGLPRLPNQIDLVSHCYGIDVKPEIAIQRNRTRTLKDIITNQNGHFGDFKNADELCDAYIRGDSNANLVLQHSILGGGIRKDAPLIPGRIERFVTDVIPTIELLKSQNKYTPIDGLQSPYEVGVDLYRELKKKSVETKHKLLYNRSN